MRRGQRLNANKSTSPPNFSEYTIVGKLGSSPSLPVEIWLRIFRLATHSSCVGTTSYYRNETFETASDRALMDHALRTKYALIRVCRSWSHLGREFLYEDVRIRCTRDSNAANLLETLKISAVTDPYRAGYGRWVRRIELRASEISDTTATAVIPLFQILHHCPNIEVLVKLRPGRDDETSIENLLYPPKEHYHPFQLDQFCICAPFLSLTRIEGWYCRSPGAVTYELACLFHILHHAPNLHLLSLSDQPPFPPRTLSPTTPPAVAVQNLPLLPSLHTLRIGLLSPALLAALSHFHLPTLRSLHIASPTLSGQARHLLQNASWRGHLRTLALGARQDIGLYIAPLAFVPQLDTLAYATDNSIPYLPNAPHCPGVRRIILWASFSTRRESNLNVTGLKSPIVPGWSAQWRPRMLDTHFHLFLGPEFPALESVILRGDWEDVMQDRRFMPFRRRLGEIGCLVEHRIDDLGLDLTF